MLQLLPLTRAAPLLLLRRRAGHGRLRQRCRGFRSMAIEGHAAPSQPSPQDSYYAPLAAAGRRPPLLLDVGGADAFRRGHVKVSSQNASNRI